ncbi:ATP-binding protein [Acetivibrio thermocellus]|nr:ATP-binding protein [Acetivibrio thermocellus]THJ76699.1 biotin carboxylase [Acetivibrio thermocellus]
MKIKRRDSADILNALAGGVVPKRGLQYIMVGREAEMKQIREELRDIRENGNSMIRFFIGTYGTGKSFMQNFIRQVALEEGFVVTNADFTPHRRLYGSDNQALALYNELIKNLSTKSAPQGNALPIILDQWIMSLQNKVMENLDYEDKTVLEDNVFVRAVEKEIVKAVSHLDELTGGYDFAKVLSIYYKSFVEQDKEKQRQALRWLRGEYLTKSDALRDLGIREIIDDSNYYAHLKVLCKFVRQAGYSGLIINLDEAVNLYKITHREAREKNYDYILTIYNDILQGSVEGLYITFSGTPEFLEDERRGLYSYQALKRRLKPTVENEKYQDLKQAVIKLTPLTPEEILILLMNIRDIHAAHYGYEINVMDEEIRRYLLWIYKRPGAKEHIILGDVVRQFISFLNIKMEHPTLNFEELYMGEETSENNLPEEVIDIHKRFKRTQLS